MVESLMRGVLTVTVGLGIVAFVGSGLYLAVMAVADPGRLWPWLILFAGAALLLEAGARLRVRIGRVWEISGRG